MLATTSARLVAAQKGWGKLLDTITLLGWRDHTTHLLLFKVYIQSTLLYGGAVWGPAFLPCLDDVTHDWTGQYGVFYWCRLWSFIGLPLSMCNEVLYTLSGRAPLQLYLGKQVI